MAVTVEQLIEQVQRVFESRGKRVVEVSEADAAEAKAATERSEADAASASEDEEIAVLKQLANDYTKE